MPTLGKLEKAELQEISWDADLNVVDGSSSSTIKVQFNPETLSLSTSNTIDTSFGSAYQFANLGPTVLTLELWFDVTASVFETTNDVRLLTQRVHHFMLPKPAEGDTTQYVMPGVRFLWGSFLFEGVMTSFSEAIDFFSKGGRPLRSKLSVSIQSVQPLPTSADNNAAPSQVAAAVGDTVQALAMALAVGIRAWRLIANLNEVENPRLLTPGSLLKMPPKR
jgi:hypothetical protein